MGYGSLGERILFLVEPPPTRYDLHFKIAGVPVRVHPMFWIVTLLLGAGKDGDPEQALLWTLAVFPCILIHELGHVAAFRYYGLDAHVVLYSFGGMAIPSMSAWGPRRGARETWVADAIIALAGPVAGFVFAAVIFAGLAASGRTPEFHFDPSLLNFVKWDWFPAIRLNLLIWYAMFININWGIVNLMPVYPLDGGQVARAVLSQANPADSLRQTMSLSMVVAIGLAVFCIYRWDSYFGAFFFGYMAYTNYLTLQQITGRGRW